MSLTKLYLASSMAALAAGVAALDARTSNATLNATLLPTTAVSESYKDPNKVLSIALTRVETATTSIQRRFFKANVLGVYGAAYLAELSIGTSRTAQKVDVLLDTGSFELWVNPDCARSNVPSFCQSFGRYDPALSSTALGRNQSFNIQYGSGSASGPYYADDVFISGAKITKQQFGVANTSELLWFGVMGLAHGRGNGFINYDTVIDSLAVQGFTNSRLFSLDLGSQGVSAGSVISGEMVFGGVDKNKYAGNLLKVPTDPNDAHYTVQLAGLAHRPPTAQAATPLPDAYPVPVIVDSGTTLSLLPQELVDALAAQFPGASRDGRGGYRVPCGYRTQAGTVVFSLAGGGAPVTVRVAYADFVWDSGNDCYLGAWHDPAVGVYILGDTFLRGAYVVFDQDSDALYVADYVPCGNGASDLAPVPSGPDQAAQIPGNCVPSGGAGGGGSGPTTSASLASGPPASSVTALDPSANPPGPVSVTSSLSTSSAASSAPTASAAPDSSSASSTTAGSPGSCLSSTTGIPSASTNTLIPPSFPSGPMTASASALGVDRNAVPADGSSGGSAVHVTTRRTVMSTITNRIVYTVTACPSSDAGCTVGRLATSTSVRTTTFCPGMGTTPQPPAPSSSGPAFPPGAAPAGAPPAVVGGDGEDAVVVTVQEQCHTRTFAVTSCAPAAGTACTVGMTTTATYTQYRTVTAPAAAAAAATGSDDAAGAPAVPPVAQVGTALGPEPAAGPPSTGAPYGNGTTTNGPGETPDSGTDAETQASSSIAGGDSEAADFPSVVAVFPAAASDMVRGTGPAVGLGGGAAVTGMAVVAGAGRTGTTTAWAAGLGAVLAGAAVGFA